MLDKKFIDKIEDLRHHTYSRITELQKNLCPMVKEIYLQYQFDYWYEGYKYNLWQDNTHLYAVSEIPYCYDNDLKNTTFRGQMDQLVAESKVWPFILFIDGVAIQWSKIHIIHDYDHSYIMVDDIYPDYSFFTRIVVFPIPIKKLRYGEDNDILVSNTKGLYFQDGKLVPSVDFDTNINIRLEILDDNIYFNIVDLSSSGKVLEFKGLPDGFIPTIDNILTFNDDGSYNSFGPFSKIEDIYHGSFNLFKLLEGYNTEIKWAVLMYNTSHEKQTAYMYNHLKEMNKESILNILKSNQDEYSDIWIKIISPLIKRFDFDFDYNKSYEDNINNAARYITRYDFNIWKDTFIEDLNIKSYCYTGKEFKNLADEQGYIHISRKHGINIEDSAIMFVNSKLYYYVSDITYNTNTINIPYFGINDNDHVELVLFTECNNGILDIKVPDSSTPVYIHPEYNLSNCYIMADFCPDSEYDVPDSIEGRKQYIVDCNYTVDEKNNYLITFGNNNYYNKNLKIVPKRQFRYYRYKYTGQQDRKIILPTQFNYCHDFDRYIVFINGQKIDKEEYTITFMNKYRPFDKLILYISTILDIDDYVDIFYVPELLVEKYKQQSMPKNGLLMLEDTNDKINYPTTYPMSKDTVMIFVNGYKVNPLDIKDIDLNTVLINVDEYVRDESGNIASNEAGENIKNNNSINSIYNITILEFVPGNKEVSGYLEGLYEQTLNEYNPDNIDFNKPASDSWKNFIKTLMNEEVEGINFETIFGKLYEITNPVQSYKENFADLKSIVYDAVLDYYVGMDNATTGSKFVYDFERDEFNDGNTGTDVKHINLVPDKDKLYDYQLLDTTANTEDVISKKTFMDIENN